MMRNKKTIKKLLIALLVLLLAIGFYKALDLTNYHFVKARAVNYLCDKYDAKKDEFELVDYLHSGFHSKYVGEWVDFFHWNDFSFEFKYKDKNFFVNRYKGKFYDDYQIDDIEKWCTEWLKENVDEHIDSVSIETEDIVLYLDNTGKNNKYIFSKSDSKEYITKYVLNPVQSKIVYISYDEKCENVNIVYDNVKSKMDDVFSIDSKAFLNISSHTGRWEISKYIGGPWKTYYF